MTMGRPNGFFSCGDAVRDGMGRADVAATYRLSRRVAASDPTPLRQAGAPAESRKDTRGPAPAWLRRDRAMRNLPALSRWSTTTNGSCRRHAQAGASSMCWPTWQRWLTRRCALRSLTSHGRRIASATTT